MAFLCLFAFLAGFVDAMVGGGGLIQLPAFFLFLPQLTLVQTLATNKTASFAGTSLSAFHYLKKVKLSWKALLPGIAAAATGAFCGALLVSFVHKEQFTPVLVMVLALVLAYTLFNKKMGLHSTHTLSPAQHLWYSIGTGLIIGLYDGCIGPGTGSFLVFAFVLVFGYTFVQAAANAKVLNCVTNAAALTFFVIKGAVMWKIALPVAAANMLGNYAGTKLALRKGSGFIRVFFLIVVLGLLVKLGWDYSRARWQAPPRHFASCGKASPLVDISIGSPEFQVGANILQACFVDDDRHAPACIVHLERYAGRARVHGV